MSLQEKVDVHVNLLENVVQIGCDGGSYSSVEECCDVNGICGEDCVIYAFFGEGSTTYELAGETEQNVLKINVLKNAQEQCQG